MNEPEIIKELDATPVGIYGLRKRLTRTQNIDGTVVYSVRAYAPRPVRVNMPGEAKEYVPARGIDLTEDQLKEICKHLREFLYNERNTAKIDIQQELDKLIEQSNIHIETDKDGNIKASEPIDLSDFDNNMVGKENYEYDDDNEDPFPSDEFEYELDMEMFEPVISFRTVKNTFIELNMVSWHNEPIVYDLREFRPHVNSRGYEEYTPELDKGIELNDIEAEMLCQGIEDLFPEIAEETADMHTDNYENKCNTIRLDLSDEERSCAVKAMDAVMQQRLEDRLSTNGYGDELGERDESRLFDYLCMIRRKLITGERLSDEEALICLYAFYEASERTTDYTAKKMLDDIAEWIDHTITERDRLPSVEQRLRRKKRLTGAEGEFNTAVDILRLMYRYIYEEDPAEENNAKGKEELKKLIDQIVIDGFEIQNDKYIPENMDYKTDAGKNFIKKLITAMDNVADSPIVEPY